MTANIFDNDMKVNGGNNSDVQDIPMKAYFRSVLERGRLLWSKLKHETSAAIDESFVQFKAGFSNTSPQGDQYAYK